MEVVSAISLRISSPFAPAESQSMIREGRGGRAHNTSQSEIGTVSLGDGAWPLALSHHHVDLLVQLEGSIVRVTL